MLRSTLSKLAYYLRRGMYSRGIPIEVNGVEFTVGFRSNVEFKRARAFPAKEEEYVSSLLDAAHSASVFFDIGANIGLFSLAAGVVHDHLRVFSFEPERLNYQRLVANIRQNSLSERVTPLRLALGSHRGRLPLQRRGDHPGIGGHAIAIDAPADSAHRDEVASETVDRLVSDAEVPPPDLIKIDVEGFELQVLRGMRRTLTHERPVVFLELHPRLLSRFDDSPDELIRFIRELGYQDRVIKATRQSGSPIHKQEHLVLAPKA